MKRTTSDGTQYTLVPPGRRKLWYARITLDGQRHDLATGSATEAGAVEFAERFVLAMRGDLEGAEHRARTAPKAIPLDHFTTWLLENFHLRDEHVFWNSGKQVFFHPTSGGYLAGKIQFTSHIKRVLEHRLKFLLAHRWMPETVDHINRDRADNRLANLRAATPAQQTANRKWGQTGGTKTPMH